MEAVERPFKDAPSCRPVSANWIAIASTKNMMDAIICLSFYSEKTRMSSRKKKYKDTLSPCGSLEGLSLPTVERRTSRSAPE